MNLEVDVMDGDRSYTKQADVFHLRGNQFRRVAMGYVGEWCDGFMISYGSSLDLPTFKRYCEGCGLTVKHIKPEPQVETIKPPEWGVITKDGVIVECESEKARDALIAKFPMEGYKPIRIDWGNK